MFPAVVVGVHHLERINAVLDAQSVAAQVEFESKVRKRFITIYFQALAPSTVNPGTTWGQPGVNLGSTWDQPGVILD